MNSIPVIPGQTTIKLKRPSASLVASPAAVIPLSEDTPVELGLVLDRSASMSSLASTAITAVNTLLAEQRELNAVSTKASLLLFNDRSDFVFDGLLLRLMPDLTPQTYCPDGSTALWDGTGMMIERIGARFDEAIHKPRVLIAILTDGAENTSKCYTLEQLREVITYRQNGCGWTFILISPHAAKLAFKLGVPVSNTARWESDPMKLRALLERVSRSISAYRLGSKKFMLSLRG